MPVSYAANGEVEDDRDFVTYFPLLAFNHSQLLFLTLQHVHWVLIGNYQASV